MIRTVLWLSVGKVLRNSEVAFLVVNALAGLCVGFAVVVLEKTARLLHEWIYGPGLSQYFGMAPEWWRMLLVPALGGMLAGLAARVIRRWRPHEIIDAIEANALFGGRMSLVDSANLALLTLISSGAGASVGLEAAYTQLGAGLASQFGQVLPFRRDHLRIMVGGGAAAAIAAAFNAPLAGAFYAFELIIGSYSPAALAPVSVAALTGTFVARQTFGASPIFVTGAPVRIFGIDYFLFGCLGLFAAGLGVLTMLGVTGIERWTRQHIRRWLRPCIGGVALGLVALFYPEVLGAGHGMIQLGIDRFLPLETLLALTAAKALASAISVGSGFRGGLFSASLLIGSLLGGAMAASLPLLVPGMQPDRIAYMLVGMGSTAAAIVGAPVTMILLVLELTGDFPVALGVMVGVITASAVVRLTFGYSFATWRFHLRGVPIRGAHDIGWIRDLTVDKLMRRDAPTAPLSMTLSEFRRRFPPGAVKWVFLLDKQGAYAGMVGTADAHNPDLDNRKDEALLPKLRTAETQFLLPKQDVRTALQGFLDAETEALPVLAGLDDRRIIGFLTEAFALRRYSQELERARAAETGDETLFGPS